MPRSLAGSIIQISASGSVVQVIVGRAVQGYASGGGAVNGSMFLAEIAPKAIRGLLGAFMSINIMLGVALGYWMNYVSILYISEESNWQWRFPVLFQMVCSTSIKILQVFSISRYLILIFLPL